MSKDKLSYLTRSDDQVKKMRKTEHELYREALEALDKLEQWGKLIESPAVIKWINVIRQHLIEVN